MEVSFSDDGGDGDPDFGLPVPPDPILDLIPEIDESLIIIPASLGSAKTEGAEEVDGRVSAWVEMIVPAEGSEEDHPLPSDGEMSGCTLSANMVIPIDGISDESEHEQPLALQAVVSRHPPPPPKSPRWPPPPKSPRWPNPAPPAVPPHRMLPPHRMQTRQQVPPAVPPPHRMLPPHRMQTRQQAPSAVPPMQPPHQMQTRRQVPPAVPPPHRMQTRQQATPSQVARTRGSAESEERAQRLEREAMRRAEQNQARLSRLQRRDIVKTQRDRDNKMFQPKKKS